jgi:hypothetical protein
MERTGREERERKREREERGGRGDRIVTRVQIGRRRVDGLEGRCSRLTSRLDPVPMI